MSFQPRLRLLWIATLLGGVACGGDDADKPTLDAGTRVDGSVSALDASLQTDASADAAWLDATDASNDAQVVAYVPPHVDYPSEKPTQAFLLSQVGLYEDAAKNVLAPDLVSYTPNYTLWSDGAEKSRFMRLPKGAQIDVSDPDHWQFPVGTVFFKEFAVDGKKLETRVIARTGTGPRDYFFGSFVWRDDGSDAELAWDGASDIRGTDHDAPNVKQCGTCHNGEPGRVLGYSAVQGATAASLTLYHVPGNAAESTALGYLHANCGHCHNPNGSARPDTDLNLRLAVSQLTVETTSGYVSTVNKPLQSFMGSDLHVRITPGQPDQSGLYYRMSQRGVKSQMPPIATKHVDDAGLGAVRAFIEGLSQ